MGREECSTDGEHAPQAASVIAGGATTGRTLACTAADIPCSGDGPTSRRSALRAR
jgi:hypothetical protein